MSATGHMLALMDACAPGHDLGRQAHGQHPACSLTITTGAVMALLAAHGTADFGLLPKGVGCVQGVCVCMCVCVVLANRNA
jgi:hypothetical protein